MTTHDASDARCHVYGRRAARFAPHTRERDYPPHPTHARASAARRVDDASTMRRPRRPRDVATSRPRSIDRIDPRARAFRPPSRALSMIDRMRIHRSSRRDRPPTRRAAAGQRRRPWRTGRSCATRGRGRSPRTGRVRTPMCLSNVPKHHHARHPIHGHTYDLITIGHGRPLGHRRRPHHTDDDAVCPMHA